MERAKKENKPFFLWWNSTRMHIFTHLKKESEGKTGLGMEEDDILGVPQAIKGFDRPAFYKVVSIDHSKGQCCDQKWDMLVKQYLGSPS